MNDIATLQAVQKLENLLLQMPQAGIQTIHTFLDGVYERKIIVPPWTVLTGAAHKTDYRVRLEQGCIAVNTEDGIRVFSAPFEMQARAGIKRVGRVFDLSVVWVDIYANDDNCRDVAELEARLYEVPDCGLGETRLAAAIERDRLDYSRFLIESGLSKDAMSDIMAITRDLIPMPSGFGVEIRASRIEGLGLFATRYFKAGGMICPGRLGGNRTPAGRFMNHSADPNARAVKVGDDIIAFSRRWIFPGEEITVDYRESMLVNFGSLTCLAG